MLLQIKSMDSLKVFNGSLLKISVSCDKEEHYVLLKLQSLRSFPQVGITMIYKIIDYFYNRPRYNISREGYKLLKTKRIAVVFTYCIVVTSNRIQLRSTDASKFIKGGNIHSLLCQRD